MRKKTAPRTRKQNKASPCEQSGLIAQETTERQSAGGKCVLDNRSHRTSSLGWRAPFGARGPRVNVEALRDHLGRGHMSPAQPLRQ